MKILVVSTTDSMIWNFLVPHIEFWQEKDIDVEIACSRTGFYFKDLQKKFIIHEIPFERAPFRFNNLKAYIALKKLVGNNHYSLIVSQEPVGGVLGRLVARKYKLKNIYTAHGFHFYKGARLKYWLLFYPVEKWLSKYTDVLVTLNREDYERSKRFYAKEIKKIDGIGVNLKKFHERSPKSKHNAREKLGINDNSFVILTVAELIQRKNYETALRALEKSGIENAVYLICGDGILLKDLMVMTLRLGLDKKVRFLGFRQDVCDIYHAADVFLFPSFQEGLSIALIEAMAIGLPIVCSDIRGNNDLVVNGKGGFLFAPHDVNGFAQGLAYCRDNDTSLLSNYNIERAKKYDLNLSIQAFYEIINRIDKKCHSDNESEVANTNKNNIN